jgi:hypothetical protein
LYTNTRYKYEHRNTEYMYEYLNTETWLLGCSRGVPRSAALSTPVRAKRHPPHSGHTNESTRFRPRTLALQRPTSSLPLPSLSLGRARHTALLTPLALRHCCSPIPSSLFATILLRLRMLISVHFLHTPSCAPVHGAATSFSGIMPTFNLHQ